MGLIRHVNASFSKTNEIDLVASYLTVDRTFWKKKWVGGRMRRVPVPYETSLITRKGIFLAGWNNRIARFLKEEGCKVVWRGEPDYAPYTRKFTGNLILKPPQKEFVNNCLEAGRGIIDSATGSGKTVMEGAVLSAYYKSKRLVLCHTKKLLHQLADRFENQYDLYVTKVGDGHKNTKGDVIVAIINSWAELPDEIMEKIDVILVDEGHHVNSEDSLYFKTILRMTNAWNRFAFTATLPPTKEGRLICEGCFGKVIGKLSIATAIKLGMFAKPKVILLDAPIVETEATKYSEIYRERIVNNKGRNRIIANKVKEVNEKGESCLIYVKEIEHGNILRKLIPKSVFVYSKVSGSEQGDIADRLDRKDIMDVIATTTWKEGVDTPSLNNVFNAAGGKSEIAVIQNVGRGARVTKDKKSMTVFDFVDHGKFLEGHTCERLAIYIENDWL